MAGFFFQDPIDPAAPLSPGAIERKRRMAEALLKEGTSYAPVQHWTQGFARMADALAGSYEDRKADAAERSATKAANDMFTSALGSGGAAPMDVRPQPQGGPAPSANGSYANAISGIESGGRYDALGPVTKTGDRAFGKYQVMGANIPEWSQAALGRAVTPEEFLADPKIQDAVFNHRFGQYAQKYGPEGAAKAWFAGEGGMKNPNARDQLGTSVSAYGSKFMRALGAPGVQAINNASPEADLPAPGASETAGTYSPFGNLDATRAAMGRIEGPTSLISEGAMFPPIAADRPAVGAVPAGPAPMPAPRAPAPAPMAPAAQPPINWGDADNPADFWRGSQALMARNGGQTPPGSPMAAALAGGAPAAASAPQGNPASSAGAPQAPAAPAAPGGSRMASLLAVVNNPWSSAGAKSVAAALLQKEMEPKYGFQTLPDGTIIRTDARQGSVTPIYQSSKPTFGVIGQDEFGNNTYGFIDPTTGSITPVRPPGTVSAPRPAASTPAAPPAPPAAGTPAPPQPEGIPPAPPGVNPKTWRDEKTRELARGEKFTESQGKALTFANRMENSEALLSKLESEGAGQWNRTAGNIPVIGNRLVSEDFQKFKQAEREFINAVLRRESGAVIGDAEYANFSKQYFPQPGDTPDVIAQKRQSRKVAIDAMKKEAGPNYKPPAGASNDGWVEVAPGIRIREAR